MKRTLKAAAARAGLLVPARAVYNTLCRATASNLLEELRTRLAGSPDGLPIPGPRLIHLVIGTPWRGEYLRSGAIVAAAMRRHCAAAGVRPEEFRNVLDFGCGCGRLIRHVRGFTPARMHGSDYNPMLVDWCASRFPWGSFALNGLHPPLGYAAGAMDFIYARSVFTHLDAPLQTGWMRELHRILAPGGVLYFTTHGDATLGRLGEAESGRYGRGELVVVRSQEEGTNLCAAFHPPAYVRSVLQEGFDLLLHAPGTGGEHDLQDVWVFRKSRGS